MTDDTRDTRDTLQRVATELEKGGERAERIREAIARWAERQSTEPSRERPRRRTVKRILPLLVLFLTLPALAADYDWRKSIEPRWYVGAGPTYTNDERIGATALVAYKASERTLIVFGPTWSRFGSESYRLDADKRNRCTPRSATLNLPARDEWGFQAVVLFQVD